jgi:glycosyltransferase involved in cell wall biosynthesis
VTILYNEERNILKTINSIKSVISGAVIGIDNKTNDNTQSIIESEFKKLKLPLQIYKFDFNDNYSACRNIGLQIAKTKYDFIIIVDGDERLHPDSVKFLKRIRKIRTNSNLYKEMESIVSIMIGRDIKDNHSVSAPCIRLFKPKYRYRYRIHESPNAPQLKSTDMPEIVFINDKHPADRISKPNRNRTKNLLLDIKDYPNASEQMFNLGMEYMAKKQFKSGLKWLKKATDNNLSDSMKYMAYLKIARCYKKIGEHEKQYNELLKLINTYTGRCEHLIELGIFFLERENYFNAMAFIFAGANIKKPKDMVMTIDSYYKDVPWKLLLLIFSKIKYKEGINEVSEILEKYKLETNNGRINI